MLMPPNAGVSGYHTSYLYEFTGGSQYQPGIIAPSVSHLQDPISSGYNFAVTIIVCARGSAFQQTPASHLYQSSFGLAQNAPLEPPFFSNFP
jgi:hypothetical protein